MRAARTLIASLAVAALLGMLSVVAVAAPNSVGLAASASAAEAQYCPAGEKQARQNAVKSYTRQMVAARKAYFTQNRGAKARSAFVTKQNAQLKALKRAVAACS